AAKPSLPQPKALKNRSRKKLDYGRRRSAPQMTAARRHDSSDYLSAARPRSPQSAGASPQSTWSGQQPLEQLGGRRPHQARSTGGSCLSLRSNRRTPAIGLTSPSVPENAAPEAGSAPERSFEESQRVSGGLESGHGSSMSSHGSLDSGLMPENGDESDDSSSFGSSRGFCNRDEPTGNAAAGAGGEELQVDSLEHSPDAAATGHLDAQIQAESPGAAATGHLDAEIRAESPGAAATGHLDAQIRAESPGAAATGHLDAQIRAESPGAAATGHLDAQIRAAESPGAAATGHLDAQIRAESPGAAATGHLDAQIRAAESPGAAATGHLDAQIRAESHGAAATGHLDAEIRAESPGAAATGHLDAQIRAAESPGAAATRQLNVQSGASQHGQRGRFRKFLQQLNCFKAVGSDADSGYSSLFSSRISLASRVSNSTNPPNTAADCEHSPLVVSGDAGSALGGTSGAIEAMPMESTV
ncbi:hypothetical protein BOX15_Mlig009185g1, partial [Macrostomum lignano]